jgi:hypothetical protein
VALWAGRGGSLAAAFFGAQAQPPEADTWQSNCSAATAKGTANGCIANRLPVTSNGNFLRNAGDFTAILFSGLPARHQHAGSCMPLDGLKKMLDNKA